MAIKTYALGGIFLYFSIYAVISLNRSISPPKYGELPPRGLQDFVDVSSPQGNDPLGNSLKDGESLDILLYASEKGAWSENNGESTKIGEFIDVPYDSTPDGLNRRELSFVLPAEMQGNKPTYLHVVIRLHGEETLAMPVTSASLSSLFFPVSLQRPTYNLLRDPAGQKNAKLLETIKSTSIPVYHLTPEVEIFMPIEASEFASKYVQRKEWREHFVVRSVNQQYTLVPTTFSVCAPKTSMTPLERLAGENNPKFTLEACRHQKEIKIVYRPMALKEVILKSSLLRAIKAADAKLKIGIVNVDWMKYSVCNWESWKIYLYIISVGAYLALQTIAMSSEFQSIYDGKDLAKFSIWTTAVELLLLMNHFLYLIVIGGIFVVRILVLIRFILSFYKFSRMATLKFHSKFPFIYLKKVNLFSDEAVLNAENHNIIRKAFYPWLLVVISIMAYQIAEVPQESWLFMVIKSLAYASPFGGLALHIPQYGINAEIKSTSHLPWKKLYCLAVCCILDSALSLVMLTPLLHRLVLLRDDLTLILYLYQSQSIKKQYGREKKELDAAQSASGKATTEIR